MPDKDYGKLADELLPKKEKAERDCQGYLECYADGKNGTIDDCKPVVIKLLKEIDKKGISVGEIEEILSGECQVRWEERGHKVFCGHPLPCPKHTNIEQWKKQIAQAILNKLKEKE